MTWVPRESEEMQLTDLYSSAEDSGLLFLTKPAVELILARLRRLGGPASAHS